MTHRPATHAESRYTTERIRRAVHQFHASSAYGDAVTNSLLFTRRLLQQLGFESEIYVDHVAPRLRSQLKHLSEYRPSPDNLLLVHHSMGHDRFDWVQQLPDRKLLVYHNITPPEFFPDDANVQRYSVLGREQLKLLRPGVEGAICVSEFNAAELRALGYRDVTVIPLLFDSQVVRDEPWNRSIVDAKGDLFTVLFVGRVERNKCHHDVIEAFRHLDGWLERPAQLVFVGHYNPYAPYIHELQRLAESHGLSDRVRFLGHVPTEDVYGWYRAADVFLCLSEHEGFGVPLLEAMSLDVPVIAYASSNIPHTLGGAGILLDEKSPREIAALICLLSEDRALRRNVIRRQRLRAREFCSDNIRRELAGLLARFGTGTRVPAVAGGDAAGQPEYQIEGPFETSYSLALVNRELAFALDSQQPGTVGLFATEGPGDYAPDASAIQAIPGLDALWKRGTKRSAADVVIRNLYPPRVHDMDGSINLLQFAWEESGLPADWVTAFNRYLDGVVVPSAYVKKVLIDAGVEAPVRVIGHGIEHVERQPRETYPGELGRAFRFLHVSSGLPRKGIDVLLRAYTEAFSSQDDVTLIVKTCANVHNTTEQQLRALQNGRLDGPDVRLITEDLPPGQLVDLYQRCHAFVAPSRGEGYGLPMAEAMFYELPVVTTAFGGQADFATNETAWTIDFRFARSGSHMGLLDSAWVEPDVDELARAMRTIFESPRRALQPKLKRAKSTVTGTVRWEHCASRLRDMVAHIDSIRPCREEPVKLAWVSTWNSKCGIATYSRYLLDRFPQSRFRTTILAPRHEALVRPDEDNVRRCWELKVDLADLEKAILDAGSDAVVLQFNFGLFEVRSFGALVRRLARRGVKTIVLLHSTKDVATFSLRPAREDLALADRLLVHGVSDLNTLKAFDLIRNVTLLPHGVLARPASDPQDLRRRLRLPAAARIVASYGFLLPHKGIEQLIEAFAALRRSIDARLLLVNALYPSPESQTVRDGCAELITRLGLGGHVTMIDDFLQDEESLCLLECADVVVFPHQSTAESASGAVRIGLASGRPVACTPLDIFEDVGPVVHRLPGTRPAQLATGLARLLTDEKLLASKHDLQQQWLQAHSWTILARRLSGMLRALVKDELEEPVMANDRVAVSEEIERTG